MTDAFPTDPESEGIPDTADDYSTAWDDVARPRPEDSHRSLPADEPIAVDDFGVSAQESHREEPLSARLMREEPDVSPSSGAEADEDTPASVPSADLNEPIPGSVGRLVAPDEGVREDDEGQSIGYDTGEGEGLSAEEAAMREEPEER